MESDPIPNRDEDFDSEGWDEYFDLVLDITKRGLSMEEWLDVMTPIWQEQMRKIGYDQA